MGQKEAALQELEQAVTMEEEDINAHLQKVCCFIESLLHVARFPVSGIGVQPDTLIRGPQVSPSCNRCPLTSLQTYFAGCCHISVLTICGTSFICSVSCGLS